MKIKFSKGFTLIELLVVISIISLLSALLLSNFVGVRQRGRDGQRKSDLRQIQSALELYRADNGTYLATLPECGQSITNQAGTATYMKKVPCDPLSGQAYSYVPSNDSFSYMLSACIENDGDSQKDTEVISGCVTSFSLTNP
jgi:general secretion pathway protein G